MNSQLLSPRLHSKHLHKIILKYISYPICFKKELLDNTENILRDTSMWKSYDNTYTNYTSLESKFYGEYQVFRRNKNDWTITSKQEVKSLKR
jgi:hypothetical protein